MRAVALSLLAGIALALLIEQGSPLGVRQTPREIHRGMPRFARTLNWVDGNQVGSCVYADLVTLLKWQGQFEQARRLRGYSGPANYEDARHDLTREGVRFCDSIDRDVEFIKWACRTRRFCGVGVRCGGAVVPYASFIDEHGNRCYHHVIVLWLDADRTAIYDTNAPNQPLRWVKTKHFLDEWIGWAVTPAYSPSPPIRS